MKLSSIIATLLTVSSLSFASAASAQVDAQVGTKLDTRAKPMLQYKQHTRNHRQQRSFMGRFTSVNLTAEQQQQVQIIVQQHKAERSSQGANKQHYADTKAAMQQLMQADYFDQTQAEQLIQQRQPQQQARQLQRLKLQHDLLQVLTPEQRQQLAEAKQHKRQHQQPKHKQARYHQHKV